MQEAVRRTSISSAPALYRDRLAALSHVQAHQGINPHGVEEADVFAIHQEGGQTCIQVFFFRTGQNWGNRAYFPKADPSLDAPARCSSSFLAQFYDDKPVPRLILLSRTTSRSRSCSARRSRPAPAARSTITVPQRGEKTDLVDHALQQCARGARPPAGRNLDARRACSRVSPQTFGLPTPPRRIEVYDNSHIMGTNAVGAMVVAGPEGFVKNQYRKFNIRSTDITPGDDFGMMREVMTRRFSRLLEGGRQPAPRSRQGGERRGDSASRPGRTSS